jgi:DNA-binding SARP family transcriptional activator
MRTIGRRLFIIALSASLLAAVWLLVETRPGWPTHGALTATAGTERLLIFIAWLGCLLLAIGLFFRIALRKRRRQPREVAAIRHLHRKRGASRPVAGSGYPDRAFPLVLQPRSSLPGDEELPGRELENHTAAFDSAPEAGRDKPLRQARIEVLGPLTISGTRKRGRGIRGPTRELLAFLVLHPNGAHRDQVIDALWPDQPPERGRNQLWRAAADARHHLGETILTRDNEHYRLERTQVTIDLDELENLLVELDDRDDADALPLLERALALFTGEPLAGSDLPWAENEQRRLHAIQLELFERAGEAHLAAGDPTQALACAEQGLGEEPYNETLVRLAMRAEGALGLRSAIVSRYGRLCEILDEQLGLNPHRETKALYRALLGQDVRIGA